MLKKFLLFIGISGIACSWIPCAAHWVETDPNNCYRHADGRLICSIPCQAREVLGSMPSDCSPYQLVPSICTLPRKTNVLIICSKNRSDEHAISIECKPC